MTIAYRRSGPGDTPQMRAFWREHWGDEFVVAHGQVYRPEDTQGFIALDEAGWAGAITYRLAGEGCEIVTLDSLREGQGIGSRLIELAAAEARRAGCRRMFLTTTNDNLEALGFYQRRGFELAAVYRGAVNEARKMKPGISLIGLHGIPLRDEIELELAL